MRTLLEVRRQEAVADRLDHLDGDQLVVLTGEIAVVLEQQRDLVLQPQRFNAFCGESVLLFGERGGGDFATVFLRGVQRHAAPAGADFQQVVRGFQRELLANALQFVQLRLLKAVVGTQELRG
ncbi:hypothetical protein D3C86_1189180 [compost metagenome]